jgi:hypothetical protein
LFLSVCLKMVSLIHCSVVCWSLTTLLVGSHTLLAEIIP